MAKLKYRNGIAPHIIEEARNRIFNSFMEKGFIGDLELTPIKSIEDCGSLVKPCVYPKIIDSL